jgi:LmbE family N-acetylglucosaminyl deacetylase
MKLIKETAEIFVPDGIAVDAALARTTHMGISAHQDDLEIMAFHGVLDCFQLKDKWFTGVIVTNGAGSPRDDLYASFSDEEMMVVRRKEQKKAAIVGEYSAQVLMQYSSSEVKDGANKDVVTDLKNLFEAAQPSVVYTHNLGDKHDTHVASLLRVVAAIRELPAEIRPKKLLGCEVWRDLDWMTDEDKVGLDVAAHENLAMALLGVFDSQICGGKRYDLATQGRRRAHATYFASHGTDATSLLNFAMDMTPLVNDLSIDPADFVNGLIGRFQDEVSSRLKKLTK